MTPPPEKLDAPTAKAPTFRFFRTTQPRSKFDRSEFKVQSFLVLPGALRLKARFFCAKTQRRKDGKGN